MSTSSADSLTVGAAPGHPHPRLSARIHLPAILGLVVAAFLLVSGAASRETVAIGASAAAWCYLAAAAVGRPWVGWAAIPGASAIVVISELLGLPWWAGLGTTGLLLLIIGLVRASARHVLVAQAAAFAGIAIIAVAALSWDYRAGVVLAGVTLAAHAGWDVVHYRRRLVVPGSLAEACLTFDVLLGLGLIAVVLFG